jgi:4'-phosphopantetheinyl transferase EntD
MMKVNRLGITIEEQTEQERAAAVAAHIAAITDYNVMMGNLEDPAEEEDEEEE